MFFPYLAIFISCMKKTILLLFVFLLTGAVASAQDQDTTTEALIRKFIYKDSLMRTLTLQTGTVSLGKELATVNVPAGCYFLSKEDARTLVEKVYENPPDEDMLGVLVSDTPNLTNEDSWFVTFSYNEDGHIKDDDAKKLDYNELLESLKKEAEEASKQRVKLGYESMRVVNWAQAPFYDSENHKLHWAVEYEFGGSGEHTLNYYVRVLGRKGYLVLNIVSALKQLPKVNADIPKILASTNFIEGHKYADFDPDIDKIAEYGIGGLIAGGILAKTGLLAKLGLLLLKFGKLIALAVVGVIAAFRKKLFGAKKSTDVAVTDAEALKQEE